MQNQSDDKYQEEDQLLKEVKKTIPVLGGAAEVWGGYFASVRPYVHACT
jgi:hypothetical protein